MALVGQPVSVLKYEPKVLPAGVAGMPPASALHAAEQRLLAYSKVMRIFMQGSYDLAKEDALASLRSVLAISEHEHLSVRAAAMAEAAHLLQLPPAPGSQEMSVGHSSQPLGAAGLPGSGGATPVEAAVQPGGGISAAGAGAKRATPSTASRAAAAPRKRNRTAAGAGAGAAAAAAAAFAAPNGNVRAGPAAPAPRASAAQADLDPLVGRVVLRNWPKDGGWFSGIISDFRPDTAEHCIIYDMGKSSESYEWYNIRAASPQDCQVKEERVDLTKLSMQPAAGAALAAGGGAAAPKAARPPAAVAGGAARANGAGGAKQQGAGPAGKQQPVAARQGAGASKAGASRAAAGASKAGAGKPVSARAAPAAAKPPPAAPQQQKQQQSQQQQVAPAAAAASQPPAARSGKTTHHAHLANGLSSHAAAVKQVLAAGGRPPYLNGHTLLPRRSRSWSSDEDSDDSDDE